MIALAVLGGCVGKGDTQSSGPTDAEILARIDFVNPAPEPSPYWAAKPTGQFTKDELFGICANLGFAVTAATYEREKGKQANAILIELFPHSRDFMSLQTRDAALAEKVKEYVSSTFVATANLTVDEARARTTAFTAPRRFGGFHRSNIENCYRDLGALR